jgi:hypothetical protein
MKITDKTKQPCPARAIKMALDILNLLFKKYSLCYRLLKYLDKTGLGIAKVKIHVKDIFSLVFVTKIL